MNPEDERIAYVVSNTEVLRPPRQTLSTFGTTNIYYYLVTEPAYMELMGGEDETVVREGRVLAERPRIVTPAYLVNVEGFSDHARRYLEMISQEHGPNAPGLFYGYRNEPKGMNIVSSDMAEVVRKIDGDIDKEGNPLAAIIKGVDELWDVSLLKFIFDMTRYSLGNNVYELGRRGLLDVDRRGIPFDARMTIEKLFTLVKKGELDASALKMELERWDVFEEYEDRFRWFLK
ncbi:hypothetical protein ACFLXV_04270 [Chloroflexota bacterium]